LALRRGRQGEEGGWSVGRALQASALLLPGHKDLDGRVNWLGEWERGRAGGAIRVAYVGRLSGSGARGLGNRGQLHHDGSWVGSDWRGATGGASSLAVCSVPCGACGALGRCGRSVVGGSIPVVDKKLVQEPV